jgi:membrane dipeptidase
LDPKQLHRESIVFDAHCDTLQEVLAGKRRLSERSEEGHADLPRLREGGVTAQIFALFVSPNYFPRGATRQALRLLDVFYQELKENGDQLILATSATDIERAKAEDKVAGILSLEGAEALEGDLGVLRAFYKLGVRNIGLTWNLRNAAADGVDEMRSSSGLTNFGVQLVREMNRLGIMVDISHLSPTGVRDVLHVSEAPVIASHSNAYALCPHRRNLTDEQLEGIASKGGVVGVTFVPSFVIEYENQATLEGVLDQIDYMVKTMGVDHVGLGSDFDGFFGSEKVRSLEDVTHLPRLTAGLVERGYSEEDVKKILGGNFLRVFREVVG